MSWGAVIGAGASLVSGAMSSNGASNAEAAQVEGARQADATQRYFYDTSRQDQLPWLNRGNQAGDHLQYLMGLSPGSQTPSLSRDDIRNNLLGQYTKQTVNKTPNVIYNPIAGQYQFAPWSATGEEFMGQTVDEAGLNSAVQAEWDAQQQRQQAAQASAQNDPAYGSLMRNFSLQDMQADPVYSSGLQFGLDEGLKGMQRQQAASGNMLSGAALKALTRYGNDYATTKGEGAYNRFENNKTSQYNKLASIANVGQTAANQTSAGALSTGNQIAQNQIGVGNARGASAIAQGNAWGNGLAGAYNSYQTNNLMNKLGGYQPNSYGSGSNPYSGYDALSNGGWGGE